MKTKKNILDAKAGDILIDKDGDFYEVREGIVTSFAGSTPEDAREETDIEGWSLGEIEEYGIKFYTQPKEKKFKLNGTYTKSQLKEMIK